MCDDDFESTLVLTLRCFVDITYSVVACSPAPNAAHRAVIACVCFWKPILQICYKIQSIYLEREQRVAVIACAAVRRQAHILRPYPERARTRDIIRVSLLVKQSVSNRLGPHRPPTAMCGA